MTRRARIALALGFVALLLGGFAFTSPDASAKPAKTHEGRGADFAEGCGNAGGRAETLESKDKNTTHVRCNFGDYAVSCVFQDGYSPANNIDVCADSRGIVASPGVARGDSKAFAEARVRGTRTRLDTSSR